MSPLTPCLLQTGQAGISPDGTYKQKKIPYMLSDTHITEILDLVCDNRLVGGVFKQYQIGILDYLKSGLCDAQPSIWELTLPSSSWHYVQMGYDPINKMPHVKRMNSLRGEPTDLDGSKINIQDKELTPDKIKRAVSVFSHFERQTVLPVYL